MFVLLIEDEITNKTTIDIYKEKGKEIKVNRFTSWT